MNKRTFYLISLLFILLSVFNVKNYLNTKKEILQENNHLLSIEKKIKQIYSLKEKYKFNSYVFNRLQKLCNISNQNEKYLIKCEKLNNKNFSIIESLIFRHNFKINRFNITKNKIEVEIDK